MFDTDMDTLVALLIILVAKGYVTVEELLLTKEIMARESGKEKEDLDAFFQHLEDEWRNSQE